MATLNGNIFREAKQLLRDKPVLEMDEEELEVVNVATMPLLLLRQFNDLTIDQGLEELANMGEEAQQDSGAALWGGMLVGDASGRA